jgi:hypothetical protein
VVITDVVGLIGGSPSVGYTCPVYVFSWLHLVPRPWEGVSALPL